MPNLSTNKSGFLKKFSLLFVSTLLIFNSLASPYFAMAQPEGETGAGGNQNNSSGTGGQIGGNQNSGTIGTSGGSGGDQSASGQEGAPSPWYSQGFPDWFIKVYGEDNPPSEIFGERYTAAQVQWVLYGLLSNFLNAPYFILSLFGIEAPNPNPWACILGVTSRNVDINTCIDSAFSSVATILKVFDRVDGLIYVQPSSNVASTNVWENIFTQDRDLSFFTYVRHISNKFSVVDEVQAQTGFGYGKLLTISGFWQLTRNMAYTLFVIIIVVTAFMIMFKVKISPQATISIQYLIPKIATTLILITFSLAIAGLLMDLMYVVFGLLASMLPPLAGTNDFEGAYKFLIGGFGGWASRDGLSGIFITFLFYLVTYFITSMYIALTSLLSLNLTSLVFAVLMVVFSVVMFLILGYNWLKLIFVLVKNVALIYLSVITAPLQLMMDVLPPPLGGRAFSNWIKGLIGKLLVFPLVGILIFLSFKLLGTAHMIASASLAAGYADTFGQPGATSTKNIAEACEQMAGDANYCSFFFSGTLGTDATFWGAPWLGNAGAITGVIFLLMSVMCIMAVGNAAKIIEGALAGKLDLESAINEPMKATTAVGGKYLEGRGEAQIRANNPRGVITSTVGKGISTLSSLLR